MKKVKLADNVSVFAEVAVKPPDAVFHVNDMYNSDTDPRKVNLSIGGELSGPAFCFYLSPD